METPDVRHHFERSLDHAALLLALAQHRLTDRDPVYALRPRQRAQLSDNLHLFAFHARKVIELAGLTQVATRIALATPNDVPPQSILQELDISAHTTKDLWFVLNRIIHSQLLVVAEFSDVAIGSAWAAAPRTTSYWTPSVFSVQSDWDSSGEQHWVEPYHLVNAFLKLLALLEQALQGT